VTTGLVLPALVCSALGVAVRLAVATRREGIEVDGILYLANAAALRGDLAAFNAVHQPLYSLLLAVVAPPGGDGEWTGRVVAAVAGGLWAWPTVWLARETTDAPAAWPAGLLVALMPAAVEAGTRVLPDTLLGLLMTAALAACLWAARTASAGAAAVTGALGALAALAHPVGAGTLAVTLGLLALAPRWAPPAWPRLRPLAATGALALAAALVLAPQIWLVHETTGGWSWTGKRLGYTLTFSEHVGDERPTAAAERLTSGVRAEDAPAGALDYAWRNPAGLARRAAVNLHLVDKYTLPALLQSGGLALVAVGLARLCWSRARLEWVPVVSLLPLGALLLLSVESRYVVPALPALAVVAAIGAARLGRPRDGRLPALGAAALVLVLLSFAPWLARPWFREDPGGVDLAAGRWLRAEAGGAGAAFLGRYPVIGYYAGARDIPLGARPLDEALAEGRRQGARFLVVDSVRTPEIRPDLLPLLGGTPTGAGLALARTVEDRAGRRVLIYRILSPGGPA
jgi:4-amino-4-deoxy-L-arabinose transferase-like glycosyltransferase